MATFGSCVSSTVQRPVASNTAYIVDRGAVTSSGAAQGVSQGYAAGYAQGYADGLAATPSGQPPTITVVPAEGSVLARNSTITLSVVGINARGAPRSVVLSAILGGSSVEELVFNGIAFTAPYNGGSNSRVNITNGFTFNLQRLGGWRGTSVTIRMVAVDGIGQVARKTLVLADARYSWQLVDGKSNVTPFIGGR